MEVVQSKHCPFCKEEVNIDFEFCPECGHHFVETPIEEPKQTVSHPIVRQEVIRRYDQRDDSRGHVIAFAVGIPIMFGVFVLLFFVGMWLWASYDNAVHYVEAVLFVIVTTVTGGVVGSKSKTKRTAVIRAAILAAEYAIASGIVVWFYIALEASQVWEYVVPISGVVCSSLYLVLIAWLAQKLG
ncbi:MAG: hypothetical protein FK733_19600 [Asgard group archaeon]|nr:hypothetical protein [Asgard group archaeon]